MFPNYWNGILYCAPFTLNAIGTMNRNRYEDNLPEEVKEALEFHKNEYRTAREKEELIHNLYLKQ